MSVLRRLIRGTAEGVFTLGLVGLLLCVHQLWWTNIVSDARAKHDISSLRDNWAKGPDSPTVTSAQSQGGGSGAGGGSTASDAGMIGGKAFALIYIPRLGKDFVKPIVEGTGLDSLAQGVGHYTYAPETAPGAAGNFALAGHRNGHGEPFRYLNHLKIGDQVVIETQTQYFTYQIIKGPFITSPSDGAVISSVPPEIGGSQGQHLLTLTTCDPEFTSRNRMIFWGTLVETDDKRPGFKPAALM